MAKHATQQDETEYVLDFDPWIKYPLLVLYWAMAVLGVFCVVVRIYT